VRSNGRGHGLKRKPEFRGFFQRRAMFRWWWNPCHKRPHIKRTVKVGTMAVDVTAGAYDRNCRGREERPTNSNGPGKHSCKAIFAHRGGDFKYIGILFLEKG